MRVTQHSLKDQIELDRYLANDNYSGYSTKAWYLLANPNDLPVIEVAFLNGQESPTIETAEADFAVLGIRMRGYHDFGVALIDPKGGVKMTPRVQGSVTAFWRPALRILDDSGCPGICPWLVTAEAAGFHKTSSS
jgi:hypothetical protein